jgi:hypothetical protein
VVMKSSFFWDTKPCSPVKANRRFGRIYSLHLQGWRVSQARNHLEGLGRKRSFRFHNTELSSV